MSKVVYTSKVRVERVRGALRRARLPGSEEPVYYGVHGEIAHHYGILQGSEDERTTTLDHIVAAAAG